MIVHGVPRLPWRWGCTRTMGGPWAGEEGYRFPPMNSSEFPAHRTAKPGGVK